MKKASFKILSSVFFTLFLAGQNAWANDIDPNAIDDPAWKSVLDKQTLIIPSTQPLGAGALMRAHYGEVKKNKKGKEIEDNTFRIERPYDLKQLKGLILKPASPKGSYDLSASMALLLNDTVKQFNQAFPNTNIPIYRYINNDSPDKSGDTRYRTIEFGWFAFDALGAQIPADPEIGFANGELKSMRKQTRTAKSLSKNNDAVGASQDFDLSKLNLDAARQWALIRALLTQQNVTIEEIIIPTDARALILNHAIKIRENDDIIKQASRVLTIPQFSFEERKITPAVGMKVKIGCSLRDKLLGCTGPVRQQDQEWLSNISSQVLQDAVTKDQDTRLKALQYASMLCAQDTNLALSQYKTTDQVDASIRPLYLRSINRVAACNVVHDPQVWLQQLNASKDINDMRHILRARVDVTPEWKANFSNWLTQLEDDIAEKFLKTRTDILIRIDDPAHLPTLLQLLENRLELKNRFAEINAQKGKKLKKPNMINPVLEGVIAYIAVADMPNEAFSREQRFSYWKNVVDQANGKSKEELLKAALVRHAINLSSKNLNEPANMNALITGYVSLIQTQTAVALNLHAHLSKLFHTNLPLASYNLHKNEWHNVGALNNWWKTNKMLFIPTNYASKFDYDSASNYESYSRLLIHALGLSSDESEE